MAETPTTCQHLRMKPNVSAETSVVAIQFSLWGVECENCGKRWDVGDLMQALVDKSELERRLAEATSPALADVLAERVRQDDKWGEQNHEDEWYFAILLEEVGELAKAMIENHFGYTGANPADIRKEALETAAVALAIVECMDRRVAAARVAPAEGG